jgi:hypothetical protein
MIRTASLELEPNPIAGNSIYPYAILPTPFYWHVVFRLLAGGSQVKSQRTSRFLRLKFVNQMTTRNLEMRAQEKLQRAIAVL